MFDFHPTGTKALELPQVEGNVAYRPLHGEEYPLVALHKTDDAESNVRSAEEALNRICVCSKQSRAEYVTTGHGRCIAKRGNMINFMQYMSKIMQIMYGFMRKGVFDGEHTCRKSRSICQQLCSVCMNSCRRSFWRIKERFTSEPFPHIPPTRICTPLRRHPCNRTTSRVRAPCPRRFSLLTRSSGPPPHQTLSRPSCS